MTTHPPKRRFLTFDELSPIVDAASCINFEQNHWHRYRVPSHHLLLIESGRIEARTPEGVIRGGPGDLLCFRPTDLNEYGNLTPTLYYQCHIIFAPLPKNRHTPNLDEFGPLPVHMSLGKAFDEMRRVFETFCIEVPQPGAVHRFRLRAAVFEMLAIIAGVLMRDRGEGKHLDAWQRLRMRIDAELTSDFSVEAMARQMNLSSSYFKRLFKQRFGVSPKAYHAHARLQEATRLLRSTDKPIKAVAYELGFSSSTVFARMFKSHLGVAPSDIRKGMGRVNEAAVPIPGITATPGSGRLIMMNKLVVPPSYTTDEWLRMLVPRRRGRDRRVIVK